jgi:hypothetical protein
MNGAVAVNYDPLAIPSHFEHLSLIRWSRESRMCDDCA